MTLPRGQARGAAALPERAVRVVSAAAVLVLLLGIPGVAMMTTDTLPGRSLSEVFTTGRLDSEAVIQVVSIVFLLLWAWFAVTVIDEAWRIIRWRIGRDSGPMSSLSPTPTGAARRLVRAALMSSGALLVPVLGPSCARSSVADAAVTDLVAPRTLAFDRFEMDRPLPDGTDIAERVAPTVLRSNGRETPYSVAAKLGDPLLRDSVIAANRGRVAPDGTTWNGGVFPSGMTIELPEGVQLPQPLRWREYTVADGDSAFGIATTLATGARVREVADLIIERNSGHTMNDGRMFDDPSLLRAGWTIEIPVIAEPSRRVAQVAHHRTDAPPAPVPGAPEPAALETTVPAPPASPAANTSPDPTAWAPPAPDTSPAPLPVPVAAPVGAPLGRSIAAALLLCAGALGLIRIRRRQQLRGATVDTAVPRPTEELVRTERLLRSLDPVSRALRLDLALRSAGRLLVGSGAHVCVAVLSDVGALTLVLDRPAPTPTRPWSPTRSADRWYLPAEVGDDDLAADARLSGQPCPALCHLGNTFADERVAHPHTVRDLDRANRLDGDVFVDLEALGMLCLDGPAAAAVDIARAIAASLAVSPVGETIEVLTHHLDVGLSSGGARIRSADTLDGAIDDAVSLLGPTLTTRPGPRTSELRSRGAGGETWDAVVVVSGAGQLDRMDESELLRITEGGRGLGVVLSHRVAGAHAVLQSGPHAWLLQPFGIELVPVGLSAERVASIDALVAHASEDLPKSPPVVTPRVGMPPPFVDPSWELLVRILGPVGVITRAGDPVRFERGRALELVLWLSQHRAGATRTAARTAMWQTDVRDSTFSNIVSDARRALARSATPPSGEEWIGRTLTEALPLHPLVVSDADLLRARLEASRQLDHRPAIAVLAPGVELVDGMPLSGTDLLWSDSEGITSSLVVLATSATAELARHHLAIGDTDGVFTATARGLGVLPGHEELIGLRMRAHAERGNLAGVRTEWSSYERALDADRWAGGDPSPALVSLRRELLTG